MKTLSLVLVSAFLLISCGEDASRNKRGANLIKKPEFNNAESEAGVMAHLSRDPVVVPITSAQAINDIVNGSLSKSYRTIPKLSDVDKSAFGVEDLGRPSNSCGQGLNTSIGDRMTNCEKSNSKSYEWSNKNGVAGEANWKLVSLAGLGRTEIWMDLRTGMLWSDVVTTEANWCDAAGTTQGRCNSSNPEFVCNGILYEMENIKWRLPTRNDYLQADINGLRSVLKTPASDVSFWAATIDATDSNRGWAYNQNAGTVSTYPLTSLKQVRCIGAAAR